MLDISIQNLVNALVEQELIGNDHQAMHFAFSLQTMHFVDRKEYGSSRALHLVYHRFAGSNSISVFSGTSLNRFDRLEMIELKHETSHDSCWKDPGTFTKVYFEMAKEVNNKLEAAGLTTIAPANMSSYHDFPLLSKRVWNMVEVEVDRDPSDRNGYRRMISLF